MTASYKWVRMWKEVVVTCFKVRYQNSSGEHDECQEILLSRRTVSGPKFESKPSKYEGMLTTQPLHSVRLLIGLFSDDFLNYISYLA